MPAKMLANQNRKKEDLNSSFQKFTWQMNVPLSCDKKQPKLDALQLNAQIVYANDGDVLFALSN